MIELPMKLRHFEAEYASIILNMMDVQFEDKRLISLMCDEIREERKGAISPYIPVLLNLYNTMGEDDFMASLCHIVNQVTAEYGSGFTWEDNHRVELDFKTTFDSVMRRNIL